MPTGYTAAIKDGISFEKFALSCARNFGALITMRDDPHDAPIPDSFEPSNYHVKQLHDAYSRLNLLESLSEEAKNDYCKEYNDKALDDWRQLRREREELNNKYNSMLVKVEEWVPPTKDHQELKTFMISQINQSVSWDCSMEYHNKPTPLTTEEWFAIKIDGLKRDINYHTEEDKKEVDRTKERSDWVIALKNSLTHE